MADSLHYASGTTLRPGCRTVRLAVWLGLAVGLLGLTWAYADETFVTLVLNRGLAASSDIEIPMVNVRNVDAVDHPRTVISVQRSAVLIVEAVFAATVLVMLYHQVRSSKRRCV